MPSCSRISGLASALCLRVAWRRALLTLWLGVTVCIAVAQQGAQPEIQAGSPTSDARLPAGLPAQIDVLLASPSATRAHWGISVVDAATGAPLYVRNDAQLFEPASNAKLYTTAAAFALLGPAYTFRTTVVAQGELSADGHLHGRLRLVGGGDPTISGRTYPYAGHTARPDPPLHGLDDLARQVAASGIRSVDGGIDGDDSLFPFERFGSGWSWDDLQWEYGAAISALTVGDNVHYLQITPGTRAGDPVAAAWNPAPEAAAESPSPPAAAVRLAADSERLWVTAVTTAAGGEPHIGISRGLAGPPEPVRIFGTLPAGGKPMGAALAVRDPARFAAQAFVLALRAQGVVVAGDGVGSHRESLDTTAFAVESRMPVLLHSVLAPAAIPHASPTLSPDDGNSLPERIVATRISPPLAEIVTVANKVSQNLHAELLLHTLGKVEGEDGSAAQGVRVVRQFLVSAGIDPQDFNFVDGSGLSPQDLITPRATTTLLVYATRQSWGPEYRASLPVGGVDGTLANRFTQPALLGRVAAKTGTLSQVNTLSGYLTAASGRQLAFSILANDYVGEGSRATIDHIVATISNAF